MSQVLKSYCEAVSLLTSVGFSRLTNPPAYSRWSSSVQFYVSSPACAQYSGGTGEPNDSYQIATVEDLMLLGETTDDYDKHFILTADLDLDPDLPGRKIFDIAVIAPDGEATFTGVFDGNDHTISHLTIEGGGCLGLFGKMDTGAIVSNLGLEAADVNGTGDSVGGLVGTNEDGSITNCYSTGSVSADNGVGGLVSMNDGGSITSCFWNMETSGQSTSGGGTGLTMAEMQTTSTFTEAGWDFIGETQNGTEDIWWINEGKDYPRLWWE